MAQSKKRKIAVIASSRATYGYKRRLMKLIEASPDLELQVIVTGSHLVPQYGMSVRDIEEDGIPIAARMPSQIAGDSPAAWTRSLGVGIMGLTQVYDMLKPDIVLVTGDRQEMFGACATAAYMNIPVAHIQAGDVSGHIDNSARHAMTKLSHIHLASCDDSAKRVERLGEEPWRIFNVGAPQLDELVYGDRYDAKELSTILDLDLDPPPYLVIQHAVLVEVEQAVFQMQQTLEAIRELEHPTILVYPNVDSGSGKLIETIRRYEDMPFLRIHANLNRKVFSSLLGHSAALIGNSSCGILEAPSFKLPAINIGNRQRGRMQACNVINVDHDKDAIVAAVRKATTDATYLEALKDCKNPYGDGHSSERIVSVLRDIEMGQALLDKIITY